MTVIDIILIVAVLLGLFSGLRRGLVGILMDVIAMSAAVYAASHYQDDLGVMVGAVVPVSPVAQRITGFVLAWLIVFVVLLFVGKIIDKALSLTVFRPVNWLGGMVLGVGRNLILVLPFLLVLSYAAPTTLAEAKFYPYFEPVVSYLKDDVIPKKIQEFDKESLEDRLPTKLPEGLSDSFDPKQIESIMNDPKIQEALKKAGQ